MGKKNPDRLDQDTMILAKLRSDLSLPDLFEI